MTGLSGGDINNVCSRVDKSLCDQQRLFFGNTQFAHPVVGGNSHRHRFFLRPRISHGATNLDRVAQAILERAAILILSEIQHRRNERGEQIAMRCVHLDHIESRRIGACHCGDMLLSYGIHVLACHGKRYGAIGVEGYCASRQKRPLLIFRKRFVKNLRVPLPRLKGCALGACVANLNRHFGLRVLMNKFRHAAPGVSMYIAPDAGAPRCNAAFCADVSHFRVDQGSAAFGQTTVVHQVPIIG